MLCRRGVPGWLTLSFRAGMFGSITFQIFHL
jgi:hypothetical protein